MHDLGSCRLLIKESTFTCVSMVECIIPIYGLIGYAGYHLNHTLMQDTMHM